MEEKLQTAVDAMVYARAFIEHWQRDIEANLVPTHATLELARDRLTQAIDAAKAVEA